MAVLSASACQAGRRMAASPAGPAPGPLRNGVATDPAPGEPPCSGYAIDGISLGMSASELARLAGVRRTPPATGESSTEIWLYALEARRPGRMDDVRVALSGEGTDAKVVHIKATIVVANGDPWPFSIFQVAGDPRRARVTEWIWWDGTCGATMRLTKIDALRGPADRAPYLLEIKPLL